MSIKYNCYFCETERDMGASWSVCTFNKKTNANWWMNSPYCEYHDDCPYYYPEEKVFDIIHDSIINSQEGKEK